MEIEKKNTFLSQNIIFGVFVGLSYIIASYAFFKSGKNVSLNPQLNNVIMLLSIIGSFIGVRKYRDDKLQGAITYGTALGACVFLISVAAIVYGMYIYYIYRHTPELQENYITTIESLLQEMYKGSPLLDNMKAMLATFMTPGAIAIAEVFNKVFTGFIFSLFLAGILRRTRK